MEGLFTAAWPSGAVSGMGAEFLANVRLGDSTGPTALHKHGHFAKTSSS